MNTAAWMGSNGRAIQVVISDGLHGQRLERAIRAVPASLARRTICAIASRRAMSGSAGSPGGGVGVMVSSQANPTVDELLLVVAAPAIMAP